MTLPSRVAWVGLSALALAGCGAKKEAAGDEKPTGPKPVTVTVLPLERRQVERTVEVVGSLKGWEEVTVGSKRTGRVVRVFHDMGDRVAPGVPLVELDSADSNLAVAQAQRNLLAQLGQLRLKELPGGKFDESNVPAVVQAQIALEKARQNFAREKSLRQRGAGTAQDYQNAEIDERAALAALDNAKTTAQSSLATAMVTKVILEIAGQQKADMVIRAPVPSHPATVSAAPPLYAVTRRSASEGQMLKEGEAVADLVIENPLRLWTSVPERFNGEVRVGQDVRIVVASHPGRAFPGTVKRINPSVDTTTRTFQVETAVPNEDGLLRPGGFAKASIVVKRDDAANTVPVGSVVRSNGVTKIFIVVDDKARAIQVETGREGKDWVEVIGPIPAQARVVTTGQSKLVERAESEDLNRLADDTRLIVRDPDASPTPASAPARPVPAG